MLADGGRDLAAQGIPYVPFFPLGGFTPLQSSTLSSVADVIDGMFSLCGAAID